MEFPPIQICIPGNGPLFAPALDDAQSESEHKEPAQPRILVVDDEVLLADSTAAILRRAGFEAKTAYDGFDALETIRSFRPHYLLTDIMMPTMNGIELAIAVTRISPGTRILLFSGQAGILNILEETRARGFEFPLLAKPVHPSHLLERLKKLKEDN